MEISFVQKISVKILTVLFFPRFTPQTEGFTFVIPDNIGISRGPSINEICLFAEQVTNQKPFSFFLYL
jgi:hypothetical protein